MTPVERFWSKTRVDGGCIVWTAAKTRGYGTLTIAKYRVYAHRWIYERVTGQLLKPSTLIMHSCDNPACVKPQHLSPGTHRQNTHDAMSKGRLKMPPTFHGAGHPMAKLSTEQRADVIAARRSGEPQRAVASRFGISQSQVKRIMRRGA